MLEAPPDSRMPRVAWALGALVALVGALVLLGWVLGVVIVPSGVGASPMIKANTGVCLMLAGVGLALAYARRAVVLGRLLGAIVAAVGVLTLIESMFTVNVGIDQLLFSDPSPLAPGAWGRVDIARGLGKKTIAEHVGDEETVDLLAQLGIDYGQGYHLGMPAPLTDQLSVPAS